ncbi:MAG: ferrous-iron efflux pump FieF [Psychrobacter glaciei]
MGDSKQQAADPQKLAKQATIASVLVAITLIITKTWAYWMTGSVSLLGSLLDSILDGVTSLMNFFALRFALEPADDEHKFGHGKLESIAALTQSAFMIGSALVLVLNSLDVMFDERQVVRSEIGVAVSILAILLTLALVVFQKYVTKRSRSLIVEADSLHYQGDLLMNVAVILALIFVDFGIIWMDAAMAIGIAIFLCISAWAVGKKAFEDLMDQHLPEVELQIQELVQSSPGGAGCHDVRCRQSGPNIFIQFHLEIDRKLPLWSAHEIGDRIENGIKEIYPTADIIVHLDPVTIE